jgi:hypothetical protein
MKAFRSNQSLLFRRQLSLFCVWFLLIAGYATPPKIAPAGAELGVQAMPESSMRSHTDQGAIQRFCPDHTEPHTVRIEKANPEVDRQLHDHMRAVLMREIQVANTTILLGPDVVLDFTGVNPPDGGPLLVVGPCVTLKSVSDFGIYENAPVTGTSLESPLATLPKELWPHVNHLPTLPPFDGTFPGETPGSARTPHSSGPLLIFGPHRSHRQPFISIDCRAGNQPNDNVHISGFRLHGPSFGQQEVEDVGIKIFRCLNIEISNMEIAGWGGAAISVEDDAEHGPGQEPTADDPGNDPGERIGRPEQIRIFNNYIHHNQHPARVEWVRACPLWVVCVPTPVYEGHTAGYGVDVHHGAWAQIYQNVFDSNRHAIAASGKMGGYEAFRNLVLKGGGIHYSDFPKTFHTHQFDIHGTGDNGFGGQAGVQAWFYENSFQYLSGPALKIRGRPHIGIYIHDNVFGHEGLEDDDGDDAVHVEDRDDLDAIQLGSGNVVDFDPYGRYGVCDFDGDGIDDLFLATGKTWWFSSYGEFPWTYLSARTERLDQVRLGYFDNDLRCDVLTESGAEWVISSAGTGPWKSFAPYSIPLDEVVFGRFDPNIRDHRPGATRRTTHLFWRRQNDDQGEWLVTPLGDSDWELAGSSSFPMSDMRFGDFTGDGVTDVLAVQDGRWSISESARNPWQRLNPYLADDVSSLHIADLNHNNIDDLLKLERNGSKLTWWVSDDGRSKWRELRSYPLQDFTLFSGPLFAYAGRFGVAPGGGVLLIDRNRTGHFYSEAEIGTGVTPDWLSLFPY